MKLSLPGIHHVTAIAADPRESIEFYTKVLGFRLVKKTVDFDDPGTRHLYFADAEGTPGSILALLQKPQTPPGRPGFGKAVSLAFRAPREAMHFWRARLEEHGLAYDGPYDVFGERMIGFSDPHGLRLEIVAVAGEEHFRPWSRSPVPADTALRGIYRVTFMTGDSGRTDRFLVEELGFDLVGEAENRRRYRSGEAGMPGARRLDVIWDPEAPRGLMGAGMIHHIAFRAPDEARQEAWRETLVRSGVEVSPLTDRRYFRSICFREPGGVRFEIATDGPGFDVDEPRERLGAGFMLPPEHESGRRGMEGRLPDPGGT